MKKLLYLLCMGACCFTTSCRGNNKVNKSEFQNRFSIAYRKAPIYRNISGTVKALDERWTSLSFVYESNDKSEIQKRISYYYDYVISKQNKYIDNALGYYCGNGFKITNKTDVLVWDDYCNLTSIVITEVDSQSNKLSIDLIITNHY